LRRWPTVVAHLAAKSNRCAGVRSDRYFFRSIPPLHQTMNKMSTSFNECSPVQSDGMSLKQIRIERLKQFAVSRGVAGSPTALGLLIGKKPNQTSDLLSGKASFGEKVARSMEEKAGLPTGWLDDFDVGENTEPAPSIRGAVPLISSVQAGMYKEFVDNLHQSEGAFETIETTVPVNRHTFALRVKGDSMEPRFPEGIVLIVEPDLDPQPNDFVIAKNGNDETTFKQLVRDGQDWYLKPLNERYPIKPLGQSNIVGVVRAAQMSLR